MGAWGYGLFQSDKDLDHAIELADELGLCKLQEEAQAKAKAAGKKKEVYERIDYSIYAPYCSDVELVRKHLDAGALKQLIKAKEAELLTPTEEPQPWNDPCYIYVLLGACVMTLGCQLPDSYIAMLKKVYTEGGLMPEALNQMKKALFGPDGYKNGVPYDFESKGLMETVNSGSEDHESSHYNVINKMPINMGDSSTSVTLKELRDKHNNPDACGGCGAKAGDGNALLRCGRCKDRKYCSSECQQKHWKVHKKVCGPMQK